MADERTILSKDTLVPVSVIVGIVAVLALSFSYLEGRFNQLDHRLEKIESRELDRWTNTQQELWVSELSRLNPALTLPDRR